MNRLSLICVLIASFSNDKIGSLVSSKSFNVEHNDDLFHNDIIPDPPSRNALRNPANLWPDGKVYFRIDEKFSDEQVSYIRRAMNTISRVSCVRFIDAPENATSYLYIIASTTHCESHLGYAPGIRELSLLLSELDTKCFRQGAILHELMHVLGFIHQHSDPDRDKYVKILYENIHENGHNDFEKAERFHATNFGLPYDFASVLHYTLKAYSKNGKLTIEPIVDPGNVTIGEMKSLSKLDILKINKLYKCCA